MSLRDHTTDLFEALSPLLIKEGIELVHLELIVSKQKLLRVFIDLAPEAKKTPTDKVGIEDCARVSKLLDPILEEGTIAQMVEGLFKSAPYELEVSSPGLQRPLRSDRDYARFLGNKARVHILRPLSPEEIENQEYLAKNPKQKNFIGVLSGVEKEKVVLALPPKEETVRIPISLITKAHLEPDFSNMEVKSK